MITTRGKTDILVEALQKEGINAEKVDDHDLTLTFDGIDPVTVNWSVARYLLLDLRDGAPRDEAVKRWLTCYGKK